MNEDVILRTSPRLVRGMTTQNLPYFYVPDTQGTVVVANAHIASLVDVVADACTLGELSARTGQSATELEPVVAFLLARGILTSSVHERTPPPRPTRAHVWFHITNACNLGCLLCFVPKDLTSMRPEFAASLAERICRDAFAHGYEGVNLRVSGGEPLIAFDAIRAVVAHIEMLAERDPRFSSVTLSVLTNATLITAGHARYFAAKRIPVGVGIDGIGEINDRTRVSASGRGSYAQALEGIHSLANEGILPLVTCVISPSNMDGLEEFLTTVAGWGCTTRLNPVRDATLIRTLQSEGHFDAFLDRMIDATSLAYRAVINVDARPLIGTHHFGDLSLDGPLTNACGAGAYSGAITQFGRVATCQEWLSTPYDAPAGENIFSTIERENPFAYTTQFSESNTCTTCTWRSACAGACPSLKRQLYGRIDVPSPYCRVYEAIIPLMIALSAEQTARSVLARQHEA